MVVGMSTLTIKTGGSEDGKTSLLMESKAVTQPLLCGLED